MNVASLQITALKYSISKTVPNTSVLVLVALIENVSVTPSAKLIALKSKSTVAVPS